MEYGSRQDGVGGVVAAIMREEFQGSYDLRIFFARCAGELIKAAEQCFAKSMRMMLKFDREAFETQMRKHGIPAEDINKFAEGYSLDDDIWLSRGSNWPG